MDLSSIVFDFVFDHDQNAFVIYIACESKFDSKYQIAPYAAFIFWNVCGHLLDIASNYYVA